jgi:hypothetical protein
MARNKIACTKYNKHNLEEKHQRVLICVFLDEKKSILGIKGCVIITTIIALPKIPISRCSSYIYGEMDWGIQFSMIKTEAGSCHFL